MRLMMAALTVGITAFALPQVRLKPPLDRARGGSELVEGPDTATLMQTAPTVPLKPDTTTAMQTATPSDKGTRLQGLTWTEAEAVLQPSTVVVLPLGAAAQEHGPHLKLGNDLTLVDYLARRVVAASAVVAAPPLTYHHDPGFVDYPGSVSLSLATARDLTSDVVGGLARFGPRRFYVINTGTASARALSASARALASEGILLQFTDLDARLRQASQNVRDQEGGAHADEIETSMMLYIDPSAVNMKNAARDFTPAPGAAPDLLRLTRQRGGTGIYSPTGVWGDPSLATREKGRVIVESLVAAILQDIEDLRAAPLPSVVPPRPVPPSVPMRGGSGPDVPRLPGQCLPGDERAIRQIGDAFTYYWVNQDAIRLGGLWSREGDMVHPDGTIERTAPVITQNRIQLFLQRQYQGTRHPLTIGIIRCITDEIAVADGKWELRGLTDGNGQSVPTMEGLCTLVIKKNDAGWSIEAYRYTIKPPTRPVPPALQQRPGWPVIIK
jgi:creatinine amidohydrolase